MVSYPGMQQAYLDYSSTLNMNSSKLSVNFYQITQHHNPEDSKYPS
jgi:hypothetical protein